MKRHALFLATALAVASLGSAGLAAAQSTPAAPTTDAAADAPRPAARDGRGMRHGGPRGHGMHGGIERMDADGDGRVSRAEFDAARAARAEARASRAAARGTADVGAPRAARADRPQREGMRSDIAKMFDFDAIDADGDGYIVRAEVAAHRDRMRREMGARRAEHLSAAFTAADLNRDGRLSRVEVDEKMPRLSARFAWLDDNRDGFLSRAELDTGKQR